MRSGGVFTRLGHVGPSKAAAELRLLTILKGGCDSDVSASKHATDVEDAAQAATVRFR